MDNRKLAIAAAFLVVTQGVTLRSTPAEACHRFSHWAYPWAQHCQVNTHIIYHPPEKKNYYVEISQTKPSVTLPTLDTPKVKEPDPKPIDQRTPDQVQEQKDHDAMVRKYHDEINALMHLLHGESEQ